MEYCKIRNFITIFLVVRVNFCQLESRNVKLLSGNVSNAKLPTTLYLIHWRDFCEYWVQPILHIPKRLHNQPDYGAGVLRVG